MKPLVFIVEAACKYMHSSEIIQFVVTCAFKTPSEPLPDNSPVLSCRGSPALPGLCAASWFSLSGERVPTHVCPSL